MLSNASRPTEPHDKALRINLDPLRYGTFAEIGAGQEVARWFFRVGGAAGTIAKSVSAYDMAVSDAIYGSAARYVSRERLEAMLDHELDLNLHRLREARTCRHSVAQLEQRRMKPPRVLLRDGIQGFQQRHTDAQQRG